MMSLMLMKATPSVKPYCLTVSKGLTMYAAIHKSSGIVAFRAIHRGAVMYWLECNEYNDEGEPLGLYKIVRLKGNQ